MRREAQEAFMAQEEEREEVERKRRLAQALAVGKQLLLANSSSQRPS